ncbi:UDP-forming cellulose synthase catalytic subunit [Salinicola avicenniae]|uniref:UDP-forming cellulose synthase catalytic subunit n=1 Tax=Salinicola avicenniae TaxID=2916836 RepID=UPI002073C525|nr:MULTISPECIES: UDP-forming cellulose synthase catalytic subunit [unclassified Salinicola]
MSQSRFSSLCAGRLSAVIAVVVVLLALPIVMLTVTTPMSVANQGLFGLITVVAMLVLLRLRARSRPLAIFLILLSAAISTRYLYWRATETLVFQSTLEAVLGYGLFAAEVYAWIILILGYLQNLWPLQRRVVPLPADMASWPSVDVFIPTYNESLEIVQDTVLAAQNLDYPADKLNVYLLDDGRRESFAGFAATAGIGYIVRDDNAHAKAGNLNHALTCTQGELICIFDCDHVATRGFLQMTLGSFMADPGLALLQTPHHFYSPDPFERNLSVGERMPSEDELFYGLIQKGNDFWNATFFCGSCAVIRRTALAQIGGFAVETVTEDAHTALKLQRRGWRTAYLDLPLAAGLATERLSLHVGQRMRWARGMTQILRLDNPLFGRGLSLMQRLCYLNAILHFQFALPRIVFLTAPLAYLLIGQNIIAASAAMIFVYAVPHLAHTLILNSLLQGRYRFSFWAEIYETVLSFHLVRTTLVTLFSPRRGKFNVTDKGGLLPEGFFDFRIVRPHLVVAGLLCAGIVWGIVRLIWNETFGIERNVMLLNLFWASFSLVMLLAAIAVAREARQIRHHVRLDVSLPTVVYRDDGRVEQAVTRNLSMGGVLVEFDTSSAVADAGAPLAWIEFREGYRLSGLPVREIARHGNSIRLRFGRLDIAQRRQLVAAVMGRADAWLDRPRFVDHPLRSLWWVLKAVFGLFFTSWQRQRHEGKPFRAGAGVGAHWIAGRVLGLAALTLLLLLSARSAMSQPLSSTGPLPAPSVHADGRLSFSPLLPTSSAAKQSGSHSPAFDYPAEITEPASTVWESATFGRLVGRDIRLGGPGARAGIAFSLRPDDIATEASLMLDMRMPTAARGERLRLNVSLNGVSLRSLMLEHAPGELFKLELPVEPHLLVTHNRLDFSLAEQRERQCLAPANPGGALVIEQSSLLQLALQRLPLKRDLARFPLPFYSDVAMASSSVMMVFPTRPDAGALQAAALLASHLGSQTATRSLAFQVSRDRLPDADAIVFLEGDDALPGLPASLHMGSGVRLVANPRNPARTLMLVHGDDAAGLVAAARDFVINQTTLSGEQRTADSVALPDWPSLGAPAWISSSQPVTLSSLVDPAVLQSAGLSHSAIDINFRASPDLFLWPGQTFPLTLNYTFPKADWFDESASRLDVTLNDTYLGSFGVNHHGLLERFWGWLGGDVRQDSATLNIPPYLIYGENTLSLYFDLRARPGQTCLQAAGDGTTPPGGADVVLGADGTGEAASTAFGEDSLSRIAPDSTLDLSTARHFATLPNLSYFVGAGFPFTRQPDLAESAFVVPVDPDDAELEAVLDLAARVGESTGMAALRLGVGVGASGIARFKDRDLLIIGATDTPLLAAALAGTRVDVAAGALTTRPPSLQARFGDWLRGNWRDDREILRRALVSRRHVNALLGFESPWQAGRSVVVMTASEAQSLPAMVDLLGQRRVSEAVRGDVALIDADGSVTSFQVARPYQVGDLPWWLRWYWIFGERPWWLMWLLIGSLLLCTAVVYPLLKRRAEQRQHGSRSPMAEVEQDG